MAMPKTAPRPAPKPADGMQPMISPKPVGPDQTQSMGSMNAYQQAMNAYIMGGLNLSVKGCIEGEGAVCSLLQKGCSMAKTYGGDAMSAEEALMCQSVATVCPQQLDGFQIAASICLQKTTHVCDAVPQICQALTADDPSKGAECMQAFQTLCPQIRK